MLSPTGDGELDKLPGNPSWSSFKNQIGREAEMSCWHIVFKWHAIQRTSFGDWLRCRALATLGLLFPTLNWLSGTFLHLPVTKQDASVRLAMGTEEPDSWLWWEALSGRCRVVSVQSSMGYPSRKNSQLWGPNFLFSFSGCVLPLLAVLFLGQSWCRQGEHFRWKINNNY